MNRNNKLLSILTALIFLFSSCEQEEELQAINVNFSNTTANINTENSRAEISIVFSRAVNQAGNLIISIDQNDLIYGEQNDFYTEPEAESNTLSLNYSAGDNQVNFSIKAGEGLNIQENKFLQLLLESNEDLNLGQNSTVEIAFSENFIAQSGSIEMNAGGPDFTQQAFVDLSKLSSSSVDKDTWDLGFYSGNGHHVIINSTAQVMARPLDKTDLANVTAEDTVGFASEMQIGFTATPPAVAWIDEPGGDINKTAIASISSNEAENKIYIIKRTGEGRNWKKVKITQTDDGYSIDYANIGEAEFETAEISKLESHNFAHFDLDNEIADFEPNKDNWDMMYGTYTEKFPFGPDEIPYSFNDYIILNRHNTASAVVMIEGNTTYEDFNLQQTENLTFNSEINAIGSSWRRGGGPGSSPAVLDDRFFVLNDSQGNYYKVRFISMYDDDNERGFTSFEFEILN